MRSGTPKGIVTRRALRALFIPDTPAGVVCSQFLPRRVACRLFIQAALICLCSATLSAAELTPAEVTLQKALGEGTPDPIRLWPAEPPRFVSGAPPEAVDESGHIRGVTIPTITPYLPPPGTRTGRAILVCAGGGYGALDWKTHVVYAARVFNAQGIAVIGLKYRLRPPNGKTNEDIQAITLLDAQRAIRLIRQNAAAWKLDPHQIGIAGYSAGANLALNLAANFDAGDPASPDVIERQSSRPDFAVGLASWHWRQKESPFRFPKDAPPVFLVHATNDGIGGGAPIEMPRAIKADLEKLGIPVRMVEFDVGGHGVGNLIPQRVAQGFPPAKWPELLQAWLTEIGWGQSR